VKRGASEEGRTIVLIFHKNNDTIIIERSRIDG
jgi:hypothetical protein